MLFPIYIFILFIGICFIEPLIEGKPPDYYHITIIVISLMFGLWAKGWRPGQTRANLTSLAERLGLQVRETGMVLAIFPKTPTVEGRYRSRNVRFFNYHVPGNRTSWSTPLGGLAGYVRSKDEKSMIWSAVGAAIAGNNEFILETLAKGQPFAPPQIGPGLQQVSTDDTDFDKAFLLQSNDPLRAKEILTSKIRAEFLYQPQRRLVKPQTKLIIRDGEVRFAEWGSFASKARTERLAAKLDFVCDLAERIEASRASSNVKNSITSLIQNF